MKNIFVRLVSLFLLAIMLVGVLLSVISCVNYTLKAIKGLSKTEEKADEND